MPTFTSSPPKPLSLKPSLQDIHQRIARDLQVSEIPQSFGGHLATALAGAFHMLYSHTELELAKLLPHRASGEALEKWGKIWGVERRGQSTAEGKIKIQSFGQTFLPEGTKFFSGSVELISQETCPIPASGWWDIPVKASLGGRSGNLPSGASVLSAETLSQLNPTGEVLFLDGGSDAESDDELRTRLLFAIQNPPQGGAVVDYIHWITSIPGVYRAFVKTASENKPGTVGVSFITKDLTQDDTIKQEILRKLTSLTPCGAKVEFVPFVFRPLDFTFSITPRSLGEQAKKSVKEFLRDHFTPISFYGEDLKRSPGQVHRSHLSEVLGGLEGEENHSILTPVLDPTAGENEFFVL